MYFVLLEKLPFMWYQQTGDIEYPYILFDKEKLDKEHDVSKKTRRPEFWIYGLLTLGTNSSGLGFCVWEAKEWDGWLSMAPSCKSQALELTELCGNLVPGPDSVASGQISQSL